MFAWFAWPKTQHIFRDMIGSATARLGTMRRFESIRHGLYLITAGFILALSAVFALAQPSSSTATSPSPETKSASASTSASPSATLTNTGAVMLSESLTPVHGYQGVLAQTLDGATIASQSTDEKFNPASSVKLATAFAALKSFGPDHRFVTSVWAVGKIDAATGTLNGDLVITGRDPSLHYEHAIMLARQLNDLGIKTVTGNLIVTPGFTMNFDWSPRQSGDDFKQTLDAATRSATATRAWLDERLLLGDRQSLSSVPSVSVAGEAMIGSTPPEAKPLLTRKSSKLVDILKALLCYSNNFMAERIGESLGGPDGVRTRVINDLKINPDEISIASTSGLGINRMTPRAMMTIVRGLRAELRKHNLSLADILPVAGIDPGTLEDRFTDITERGSVIGKTGTLVRTDGGASSLVGQMNTKSGRVILFVIFNQRGNVVRFRENQDAIVTAIQNALGGPAPFSYRPVQLSLRLANSDYEAAKARGEVEPREQ
jgi:D-alanyl-D-alanine carboxypeptidase/D-alanyl-D-alanine-endopeptidase (penicillin-binding protein 4)